MFHKDFGYGLEIIADVPGFERGVLMADVKEAASLPSVCKELRDFKEKVTSSMTDINSTLETFASIIDGEDYYEQLKALAKGTKSFPFSSLHDAEKYLSRDPEAMDFAKVAFVKCQGGRAALHHKHKMEKLKKPITFNCHAIIDFLFTEELQDQLSDMRVYNRMGSATRYYICDRLRYINQDLGAVDDIDVMTKVRRNITYRARKKRLSGKTLDQSFQSSTSTEF